MREIENEIDRIKRRAKGVELRIRTKKKIEIRRR